MNDAPALEADEAAGAEETFDARWNDAQIHMLLARGLLQAFDVVWETLEMTKEPPEHEKLKAAHFLAREAEHHIVKIREGLDVTLKAQGVVWL